MMPFPDPYYEQTHEAMNDPRVGDHFTEMFSYDVFIVATTPKEVVFLDSSRPCTFPDDGKLHIMTKDAFKKKFSYGTINDYWIRLIKRNCNVAGWLAKG